MSDTSHIQLDNHLTLHDWLNSHFGFNTTRDLLSAAKSLDEVYYPDERSPICEFLMYHTESDSVIEAALPTYDANIKRHLNAINNKRTQPIVLRYFQYIALLYTEIFLDWRFNRTSEILRQLNNFIQARNGASSLFEDKDLEKLAFWMATGAGKTLIMHINYHQYLHYCKEALDHIVLITPNEGLSDQHLRELANSDIRCERFNVEGIRPARPRNSVHVIEVTKLVDEKRGGGVSVPVEAFEGNNLVFVDEGHKGSGGNIWRKYRDDLAETGFTFEYSATFGQALAAANNADLVKEYGKAIIFDYSYRYFYGDGYGKNFRILNVHYDEESQTETLLMGNLLSFYQQRRYFKQNTEAVRTYGLDSPLWAFVGSSVNVVYDNKRRSDVLTVVRFLHRFLKNEGNWVIQAIQKILDNNSGITDEHGNDVFDRRLNYLKELSESPIEMYAKILNEVFHADTSGALHLTDVQNAQGEIGLKTTGGSDYFGVIYIGDTSAFKKLVRNDNAGILIESEDVLTESLFNTLNRSDSRINILIGAKKFIEGWDSWRVTAMGLLNIGIKEGSLIIQLFGRGVRLRGKGMSLKRSAALDGEHPLNLHLLETLNIFAVRANFMARFRDYLTREGVPTEEPVQLTLRIRPNTERLANRLYVPSVAPYNQAAKGQCVTLDVNLDAAIAHTTQRVDIIGSSSKRAVQNKRAEAEHERLIPETSLDLVDWEIVHLQLLEYKHEKQFHNLIFDNKILKRILNPHENLYKLTVMEESEVVPTSREELDRLENLVLILLRKYIAKFYSNIQKRWTEERVRLKQLHEEDPNFSNWNVYVPQNEAAGFEPRVKHLMESGKLYESGLTTLSEDYDIGTVFNDRHLYQPLFAIDLADTVWRTSPPALQGGEKHFVEDLRNYICQQRKTSLTSRKVFFLRNQSRGKGIGFYQNEGFYPDFILWIIEGSKQRIVFIEPHGMVHEAINNYNDKISLYAMLYELSDKQRFKDRRVHMDSYIISTTDFATLRQKHRDKNKQDFEALHILFRNPTDPTYLSPIFEESYLENE